MNILFLTSSFPRYMGDRGNGNFIFDLGSKLKEKGFSIKVLSPHSPGLNFHETMGNLELFRFSYFFPLKLQQLAYGNGIPYNLKNNFFAVIQLPFFIISEFLHALIICKREKIDLIHAHWLFPQGLVAIFLKIFLKIPVVITVHGSDLRSTPRGVGKYILEKADAIISPHPELTNLIINIGEFSLYQIPNIIDDDHFHPQNKSSKIKNEFGIRDEYIVSFIGRLNDFKDPITFIKSVPLVLEKENNIKFFVIGEGNLKEDLRILSNKLQIENNVIITGNRNDIDEFLGLSTIFTALSPIENIWSTTLIEAMKSGVPCIVTESGLTKNFLKSGYHCCLIPSEDDKKLSNAIIHLISDADLRNKCIFNSLELLKKEGFDNNDIISNISQIYLKNCPREND